MDWSSALGVVVPVLVAIVTYIGTRGINAANARKSDRDSDREDFKVLKEAWQSENRELRAEFASLKERMKAVEDKLADERRDNEVLVDTIRMLLSWLRNTFPDHSPPDIPARVRKRLQESGGNPNGS